MRSLKEIEESIESLRSSVTGRTSTKLSDADIAKVESAVCSAELISFHVHRHAEALQRAATASDKNTGKLVTATRWLVGATVALAIVAGVQLIALLILAS